MPRSRAAYDDRGDARRPKRAKPRGSLFSRMFSARRLGVTTVLGIAGLAAVGVPMNALFFQDGHHPAPIFAGHAPPAPAVDTASAASETESAAEPAKPQTAKTEAPTTHAPAARHDDADKDALANLAAEPETKPARVKSEAMKAAAKHASVATKPAVKTMTATTKAAAKTETAAKADPAVTSAIPKPTTAKPANAIATATPATPKPATAKPAATAKTAAAKPAKPATPKSEAAEPKSDIISQFLGIGAQAPSKGGGASAR